MMRDKNRIPVILKRFEKLWLKHSDLRLGQLILNVVNPHSLYDKEDEILMDELEIAYGANNR
jgi:uncharacterized protein YihD (DUF1040 family)